ncbi:MAG: M56 family metallopeptidase [Candidatus Neomarinimicrobiota bacterium]
MIALVNEWSRYWGELFLLITIQNTLFLSLVFLALHLLKKTHASVLYWLAITGMAKLLLPPFLAGPAPFLSNSLQSAAVGDLQITTNPVDTLIQPGAPIYAVIFMVWILLVVAHIMIPIVQIMLMRISLRQSGAPVQYTLDGQSVNIYQSECVAVPMVLGWFKPRIYVPELWSGWDDEHRRMVIKHELAHIRRRDGLVVWLQIVVRAIYCFHPMVWLLDRRINMLRECACDDEVVGRQSATSLTYSRFLTNVAESVVRTNYDLISASTLMKQKNELIGRVNHLLKEKPMKTSKGKAIFTVFLLVTMIIPLSWTFSNTGFGADNNLETIGSTIENESPLQDGGFMPDSSYFVAYDSPPVPVGGYGIIYKNLIYPKSAFKAGIEGRVIVQVFITDKGRVVQTKVIEGIPDSGLDEAAIEALQKTRFTPAMQGDKPVGVWISVPVHFSLGDK